MPPAIVEKLNLINKLIINPLILLLFAIALLVFFIGIFQMIANNESDEGREKGRKNMIYGIIGLVIMVSVYGIIRFIIATFGIDAPPGGWYGF